MALEQYVGFRVRLIHVVLVSNVSILIGLLIFEDRVSHELRELSKSCFFSLADWHLCELAGLANQTDESPHLFLKE
jgi:hypothetical protein